MVAPTIKRGGKCQPAAIS